MTAPDEREFVTFPRGHVRDSIILASFRNNLRAQVNPDTQLAFTEDEIARATQPGTKYYAEADAIDLLGQAYQARAAYWVDQCDPGRANAVQLSDLWGRLWLGPNSKLPAVGAAGVVRWPATAGTIFVGSGTLGDPAAFVATDANGNRYQCMAGATAGVGKYADLTMRAIDGGVATNLLASYELRASLNTPAGAQPTGIVQAQVGNPLAGLVGGFDEETDKEYADRIELRIMLKPASGNGAHFMAWAREASVGIESAYVYACALNAGSTVVAVLQKRDTSNPNGPLARIPSVAILADATTYLVPPASPVVPERAFVLVTTVQTQYADMVLRVTMPQGVGGGWFDVVPWPAPDLPTNPALIPRAQISAVGSTTSCTVDSANTPLPNAAGTLTAPNAPALMQWVRATSRFEKLDVLSVTDNLDGTFAVVLATAPTTPLAVGACISPYTDRLVEVALTLEAHFDSLGPGEIVPATDVRASRAARFPRPNLTRPQRVGQSIVVSVANALGGAAIDAELTYVSMLAPDPATDPVDGPNLLVLGHVNLYAL